MFDKTKIDLNAPAFGSEAPKVEEPKEEAPAEVSQTEKEEEKKEQVTPSTEDGVSEQRVPYSRFQKIHQGKEEAERLLEEERNARRYYEGLLRQQQEEKLREEESSKTFKGSLPSYWTKMYGDNEASREAYSYELERQKEVAEGAQRAAIRAVYEQQQYEARAIDHNENIINKRLESLSGLIGRDITPEEEGAVLDIVDEYTPKGPDGSYLGDTIPFDKAWEIYQLKQDSQTSRVKKSRNQAASLTSSRSEGEPGGDDAKSSKDWNPLDWSSWKKRIPNN